MLGVMETGLEYLSRHVTGVTDLNIKTKSLS